MSLAMFNSSVQIIAVNKKEIRNNCGPRTEPCGTSRKIGNYLELHRLAETYCFLSFK